jgi:hypothetical protein
MTATPDRPRVRDKTLPQLRASLGQDPLDAFLLGAIIPVLNGNIEMGSVYACLLPSRVVFLKGVGVFQSRYSVLYNVAADTEFGLGSFSATEMPSDLFAQIPKAQQRTAESYVLLTVGDDRLWMSAISRRREEWNELFLAALPNTHRILSSTSRPDDPDRDGSLATDGPPSVPPPPTPAGGVRGVVVESLAELPRSVRRFAEQNVAAREEFLFGILGTNGALVALDTRVLVIKVGLTAGTTFGGRVASFLYGNISGVIVNTQLTSAWIEVLSPGMGATKSGDFWQQGTQSPWRLPNVLLTEKIALPIVRPYLDALNERIRVANSPPSQEAPMPQQDASLAGQLQQINDLHEAGGLSDEEFQRAKARLLGE